MAYGPKESDPGCGRQHAIAYVDKLPKGATPTDAGAKMLCVLPLCGVCYTFASSR